MSTGIYKITNKINNKNYIGKSKNIEQRWKQHIYEAKQGSIRALCRALNKYECRYRMLRRYYGSSM